jgi:hypothetical protein
MMNCDQVLTQNLRHYMLHMLRSPTESGAVEVGRSRLQNGDVAYGSIATKIRCPRHVCFALDSDRTADIKDRQVRAMSRRTPIIPWKCNFYVELAVSWGG